MLYTWRYFDDLINEALDSVEREFSPRWKRGEESEWKMSFVLPGIKKEEVELTSGNGWARVKHPSGSFRVSLPKDSDHETLPAKLDLGILELSISETRPSGTRTIRVQ
jgi:HSP20 family molecular chaperone IbpA